MLQDLTGADLFVYIQMQRQVDPRTVIVVEGAEDCGLIDAHINEGVAQSIPGYGKQSVLDAAAMFDHKGVEEVRLLIDADFDRQRGLTGQLPANIVMSEYHDLMADMFFTCPQALASVLSNFSNKEARLKHLEATETSPQQHILNIAIPVGATRYFSVVYGLSLKMRDFPVTPIISAYEGAGDVLQAVIKLATHRSGLQDPPPELNGLKSHIESNDHDAKYLCSSHDLMAAAAAIQRRKWGGSAGTDVISAAFSAAVPCTCFQEAEPIRQLSTWAEDLGRSIWTCPAA